MQNVAVGPVPKIPDLERPNKAMPKVIVVGAGISGLTSAWFLQRQGYEVLVLEASAFVGGNLQTVNKGTCQFERGPNSFMNNRQAMADLIDGAGLQNQLVYANEAAHKRYVGKHGKLVALPTNPWQGIFSSTMSMSGKLRVAFEPFVGKAKFEESIAEFVRRRLGQEMLDWLIDPFISGVFAGDPNKLSVRAAVPRLFALEKNYGSLIRGAVAKMRNQRALNRSNPSAAKLTGEMMNFRGGMHQLMTTLSDQLLNPVLLNVEVESVSYTEGGGYIVRSGDQLWQAEKIVLAVTAQQVARLIDDLPVANEAQFSQAQQELRSIQYPKVASISMAFKKQHIRHPLDGFGALFPRLENLQTLGVLFPSSIFSGRASEDEHVITVFIGGSLSGSAMNMNQESRLTHVLAELSPYLGISGQPLWSEESYWPAAIPQYEKGHIEKVVLIDDALRHLPGLYLRSNWRNGVALGDCVENAQLLAQQVVAEDCGEALYV